MGLVDWLFNRQANLNADEFDRGFDWAAGVMLRAKDSLSGELEINSHCFGAYDPGAFERGAAEAIRAWHDRVARR